MGCVTQVGEQGMNIARGAVLAAGLPVEIPGTTVNRFCGSGLQAVNFAAQAVLSGAAQLVLAGGVEHMTRVPMGSDAVGGDGPASPELVERWPNLVPQGLVRRDDRREVELLAPRSSTSSPRSRSTRQPTPSSAAVSPARSFRSRWARQVVFDRDEHPRPGTTVETLAALKPSFKEDGVLHAGNSSGIVDGAAAVVVASKGRARSAGPQAAGAHRHHGGGGQRPGADAHRAHPRDAQGAGAGRAQGADIDVFEINEAFAPVPIRGRAGAGHSAWRR